MHAPIRFLRGDDAHTVPPGVPVVRCVIASKSVEDGQMTEMEFSELAKEGCWALVDTGADHSVIDDDYAARLGITSTGVATVSGVTSTSNSKRYDNAIYLLDAKIAVRGYFVSAPLAIQNRKYQMILGMSTISTGALIMDFQNHIYELRFPTV